MADVIGTWDSLSEAQKLTEATNVPGAIPEYMVKGGLLMNDKIPIAQSNGLSIDWLRQTTIGRAKAIAPGGDAVWTSDVSYTQKSAALKEFYDQRLCDKYVKSVYGTYNNYEEIVYNNSLGACIDAIEDWIFYGDTTYTNSDEPDGLHAWAAESTGTNSDIDEGGALSLANVRLAIATMKFGCDLIVVGEAIKLRLDAALQEAEIKEGLMYTRDEFGKPLMTFDSIPVHQCNYLVAEQAGTGEGSSAMAKYTSGTKEYSMFFLKFGNIQKQEPGLSLGFGSDESQLAKAGKIVYLDVFDKLENKIAKGLRNWGYCNLLPGSKYAIGRIYGITDGAVTA
ncbi:MAG: hypothetical protein SVY53_03205 [Chloroflexota bacterium]|nr:hypothetical protein [Chloroflexota bacterium]